ncbi:hypothetical protein [Microbulbifer sp. VAAF005]|uniref:hypothetical protein n=1 Tax=unclassified Microbulbifer TaxID=2619833 RepID=UPI0024AE623B|nr:hypothetical protein [Microbulbifer sp. VAAF005]WHI48643.1 hypothetical protein P0078_09830 [Microbulbifer sp. VAAF005]WNZ57156.1 hypothetical protein QT397_07375 [Microbulbifer sp. MKSA007]
MGPTRKFALPLVAVFAMQGCLFLPADEVEGEDPFFYEAEAAGQSASFVEVGSNHTKYPQPLTAKSECEAADCVDSLQDSMAWFFPILRVY